MSYHDLTSPGWASAHRPTPVLYIIPAATLAGTATASGPCSTEQRILVLLSLEPQTP